MDSSHPAASEKYPYPEEINVREFVPIKLSKDNYLRWKTLMLGLIERQGLLGFINGEVSASKDGADDDDDSDDEDDDNGEDKNDDKGTDDDDKDEMENQDWRRSDALVQKWITGTINDDILPHVVCLKTAEDMWSKLITLGLHEREIDIKITDIVPINLSTSSDNYSSWRKLMLRFIESQGLLGLINGEVSKSTLCDDKGNNNEWKKLDEQLQRWIKETINEDIRLELELLETSKDIWDKLIVLHETNMAYPYPIEVNVADFVPLKLSSDNYPVWRRLVFHLFETQGLLGFILPPHDDHKVITTADSLAWKRTDALLRSWIIRTMNENFLAHVMDTKTASDMWTNLESLFTCDTSEGSSTETEGCSTETRIGYPYPIEVNVGDFVPIKLSKENYFVWEKLMFRLIELQGLVGFINGKVRAPPQRIPIVDMNSSTKRKKKVENPDYKAWKKTDELLQSWILGTINQKDLFSCVVELDTAQEMWKTLDKIFCFENTYRSSDEKTEEEIEEDPISEYLPLHKATLTGNWEKAKEFIKQKPDAVGAFITRRKETALMVAVRSARGIHFVKNLLESMSQEDVTRPDEDGWTALHYAAMAGNTEAAKSLVDNKPDLPNYCDTDEQSPLLVAATFGRREMVVYLLEVTKDDIDPKQFEGENGTDLVKDLILAGLYDIALSLIQKYSKLAWEQPDPVLETIVWNCSSAFKSGANLNWWQRLVYPYVPTKLEVAYHSCGGDIENPTNISFISVKQKLHYFIWKVTLRFVPHMEYIRERKSKHEQALDLVKHLCSISSKLNYSKAKEMISQSLMHAADSGIPEIVEEIIEVFPELVLEENEMGQNIFHVAILNRCEDIFNLIYQIREESRNFILTFEDSNNKSCLDFVVELKKEQKLNLRASAAGAALQMQRELQWFKEVEKHAIDFYKESRRKETTTSGTIYIETHEDLVKEGEKWMKDTATSCTIIAALIATVVFAAAITVPGGNDSKSGYPILFQEKAFMIFVTSDALALFASISSMLMFLAILTSRYSITDFLFKLPNKLIIGLLSLFVSIISMMITFGTTLHLLFGHDSKWILFPIIVFSSFPVTVFVRSQFPLLWDMMMSTYGPGIFGQQSDRILF